MRGFACDQDVYVARARLPSLPQEGKNAMKIEIWSDVVCPWCYIGKRRFETALAQFPHRDEVEVVWRSFQLDPQAPRTSRQTVNELLAEKYGLSLQQAAAKNAQVTALAAEEGLD